MTRSHLSNRARHAAVKLRRGAAAMAVASLLGACSLQPIYHRPDAPVTGTYPAGAAYGPPGTGTLPATEIGWRDFLTDARLQRMVEIALANNRDLRVAALTVRQVQAQYRIQRSTMFPQLSAGASEAASRTPGSVGSAGSVGSTGRAQVVHDYNVGLSASWQIDFFGRLESLKDQALQQYLASAQARKAFEILLVSQVADQYLSMLAFDEFIAVTQRTLTAAQESLRLTQAMFQAGAGTELAVAQAQTIVELARANYTAQVRGRAQAENLLVLLIGQPLPADLPPAVPLNAQAIVADIPEGLPSDLLTRRPDVMQAEALLRGANANIGAARAAFFPAISLTGNLGTASAALGGLFGAGSLAWSFLPSITAPIFTAGLLRAELDVATLQKDIFVAQYEKSIQVAFSEVANGLAARGTYTDQLASMERYTAAEQRSLDLSVAMFKTGVADYLSVLTAQTLLYDAQMQLVATRLARLTALVDLYQYLGGGWIERTGDAPRPADVVTGAHTP
ncbi:efflux transporter outer membrane subunit [Ramlibacter sp.]|uniref:efflux transporter outer membrane subunit n=1 Tax=Ramlibacter sp. TaxID=1917967 RepID=UPI00263A3BB8|nr:efflux transporter outer membrane subunit [Ramlibacter sp.]MDB5955245.1 multidrug transporter [Ramlibacter sp.]